MEIKSEMILLVTLLFPPPFDLHHYRTRAISRRLSAMAVISAVLAIMMTARWSCEQKPSGCRYDPKLAPLSFTPEPFSFTLQQHLSQQLPPTARIISTYR